MARGLLSLRGIEDPGRSGRESIWPGGANHISTGLHNVQGLAFSPVDFNPWHPTTLRAHGPWPRHRHRAG